MHHFTVLATSGNPSVTRRWESRVIARSVPGHASTCRVSFSPASRAARAAAAARLPPEASPPTALGHRRVGLSRGVLFPITNAGPHPRRHRVCAMVRHRIVFITAVDWLWFGHLWILLCATFSARSEVASTHQRYTINAGTAGNRHHDAGHRSGRTARWTAPSAPSRAAPLGGWWHTVAKLAFLCRVTATRQSV
jgi:hypothetical protein